MRKVFVNVVAFLIALPLVVAVFGGLIWILLATTLAFATATGMPAWAACAVVGATMTAAIHCWWPIRDGGWNPPWKREQRERLD